MRGDLRLLNAVCNTKFDRSKLCVDLISWTGFTDA